MSAWGNLSVPTLSMRVFHVRVSTGWRIYQYVFFVFLVGSLISDAWHHQRFTTAMVAFAVLFAPLSWRTSSRPRIVISPEGIVYETSLFILRAEWGDVERIGQYQGGGDGVVLARAEWERPRWLRWMRRPPRAFIPLRNGMGGPYWEPGLGDALQSFAPWLAARPDERRMHG